MTPEEAILIVENKARGRTRYEGQEPFLDEILVEEIRRLQNEIRKLNCGLHAEISNRIEAQGEMIRLRVRADNLLNALWNISHQSTEPHIQEFAGSFEREK
jgi:hypothetical protein